MKPLILVIEDTIFHLTRLCELFFNLSIHEEAIKVLDQKGAFVFTLNDQNLLIPDKLCEIIICNNKQTAEEIIKENFQRIIFCMLDLNLPEDADNKDITSRINGDYILEMLLKNDVFTFIMSTDKDSLKTLFDDLNLATYKEITQFIYKNFLLEDPYLAEYHSRLIRDYISSHLEKTKWKLITLIGNFSGINHIAELYGNIISGNNSNFLIKSKENLRIKKSSDINLLVSTEYSVLKDVLVHFPGSEIERVSPTNKDDLLFDQPVDSNKFNNQYSYFNFILKEITKLNNGKVYHIKELLIELFSNDSFGKYNTCLFLLTLVNNKYLQTDKFWELLKLEPRDLIEVAIAGINPKTGIEYLTPIPNLLFTRDNIIAIHNKLFLPPMTKPARKRENTILEFILFNHPDFIPFYSNDFHIDSDDCFEGGDFILFDNSTLFIGISDRTSIGSVRKITDYVFKNIKSVKTVVGINASLQHERSMHLDTYMGVIGSYVILFRNPLLSNNYNTFYIFRKRITGFDTEIILGNFRDLMDKINKDTEIIEVTEEREAYDDACNVLTVAPDIFLTYDRGQKTLELLGSKGFLKVKYHAAQEKWELNKYENSVWKHADTYSELDQFFKTGNKLIFEIPGSELILARGGCHCMSMPLKRLT